MFSALYIPLDHASVGSIYSHRWVSGLSGWVVRLKRQSADCSFALPTQVEILGEALASGSCSSEHRLPFLDPCHINSIPDHRQMPC